MMSAILFGFVHTTKGKTPKKHTSVRFPAVFVAIPLYSVLPHHTAEKPSRSELIAQNPYNSPRRRAKHTASHRAQLRHKKIMCVNVPAMMQ